MLTVVTFALAIFAAAATQLGAEVCACAPDAVVAALRDSRVVSRPADTADGHLASGADCRDPTDH